MEMKITKHEAGHIFFSFSLFFLSLFFGQMIKMAAIPIYDINPLQIFFTGISGPI